MDFPIPHDLQAALAKVFLLFVIATPIVMGLIALWRGPFRPFQNLLLYVATLIVRLQWRADLPAEIPTPPGEGGAIVISNHRSSIDPFFLQVISRRVTHWMVAKEYCVHFAFAWLAFNPKSEIYEP